MRTSNNHINISMIGESYVGKTTLANVILKKQFVNEYQPTIGGSLFSISYKINEKDTQTFYIWDTAGMEKYRSLAPVYYRDSVAAIVVYDVGNNDSFERLDDWIKYYHDITDKKFPILIIGNKIDLPERAVSKQDAEKFALENKCDYLETSAKTFEGIDQILPKLYQLTKNLELKDDVLNYVTEQQATTDDKKTCC